MLEKGVDFSPDPVLSVEVSPEKLQMDGDESTSRPFGRAFYLNQANYVVLPIPFMM